MRTRTSRLVAVPLVAIALSSGFAVADSGAPPTATSYADIQDPEQQLDRITRDLKAIDSDIERLRAQQDQVKRRMAARGRTWYRMVHAGLLPLGAGFETLLTHTSKVERLRRALADDATRAADLNRSELALLQRRQRLMDRKVPLEMQVKAMAVARAAMQESVDRKLAFERAFSSSAGPSDYTAVYGAAATPLGPDMPVAPSAPEVEGFRSFKGRLPFPLAGRAEVRVVSRAGAGGPGLEMLAPAGTPVRSVFGGRVAFADEYSEYGRVVILDHGDNYFTVSGNLGSIEVRVGDEVGTGGRIGTVGGAGARGMLYFEIRRGPDTLDPTAWMGI